MTLVHSLLVLVAGAAVVTAGSAVISHRADQRSARAEEAHPPSGQILDVGGKQVHVLVEGEGPDLVLLHGAGGSLRDFTFDLVGRLSDRYRVIAFDRPGHGHTDRLGPDGTASVAIPGESPQDQAALLRAAANQVGITRPILVGHSYGGSVAMAWALAAPAETAGLVILAGVTMPWPGDLRRSYYVNASAIGARTVVPAISALASEGQARMVLRAVFAPQAVPDGYAAHFGLPMSMRRDQLVANARQVIELRPHVVEMSEQYGRLALPVELIHGDTDQIVPLDTHARRAEPLLQDVRLTVLDGVGHMPHHAAPSEVVDAIDRIATRTGLGAAGAAQ